MNAAASRIQRKYRSSQINKNEHFSVQFRAAKKLQAQWKVHRMRQFRDALGLAMRNKAAITIQKHIRGYLVSSKINHQQRKTRLKRNEEFFDSLKTKFITDL